jgi:flagellar hook-associated protein 2
MSAVSFTGLSTGLDTASLVSQLVAAERAPANDIASRQSDLNTQKSIVGSLSTALASFGSAAGNMNLDLEVQPRVATTSDSHVSVAASSGATATVHAVRVDQLARAQITSSSTFTTKDAGVAGSGGLDITVAGATKHVAWTSSDSLANIASKINDAGAGVSASILYDGSTYRLMIASKDTGTANAATFAETGTPLGLADPANVKVTAQDAKVEIDGVTVARPKNLIDDAVPGLTFTLLSPHAATDADAQVKVDLDQSALKTKLSALVSAYNSVNSALHVQLDYTGTTKGTNTLFGDSTLRQLQGALGTLMSNQYGSMTLSDIGLSRDKTGALTLDDTKLSAVLAKNPNAVSDLFVTSGFASAVKKLSDAYTRAGDGILTTKSKSLTDRYATLQKQADQINKNADDLQTRLEAQFNALETAMSQLKSQSAYLASVLG